MQVENEINAYGSSRDYSPEATKMFEGPVPATLVTALHKSSRERGLRCSGTEAEHTVPGLVDCELRAAGDGGR